MFRLVQTVISVVAIVLFCLVWVVIIGTAWWLSKWYALPEGNEYTSMLRLAPQSTEWIIQPASKNSAIVTLISRGHESPAFTTTARVGQGSDPLVTVQAEYIQFAEALKPLGFHKLWRLRSITVNGSTVALNNEDPWWLFIRLNLEKLRPMVQYVALQKVEYQLASPNQSVVVRAHENGLEVKPE